MHVQKDEGVQIVQLVQKQCFCPWKSIVVVVSIFGADTRSDVIRFHKAAPN